MTKELSFSRYKGHE
jgi:hypothetical protein